MVKIPLRYKRIMAAFDDIARARLCESSGSEHSAAAGVENSAEDLSVLVESFLEMEGDDSVEGGEDDVEKNKKEEEKGFSEGYRTDSETKEMLMSLIGGDAEDEDGGVKQMIRAEMEMACRSLGNSSHSSEEFKRRVMSRLRQRGFDAGLCKSRWEKTARHPAGKYEYIDIIISRTRYIIEVSLTTEFTIARPTDSYTSLLELLPDVLVCREGELKQVVRLICAAMRESMKKRDMHVPPWRRNGYMQAKWFGSYKRTTNTVSPIKVPYCVDDSAGKSLVGFETSSPAIYFRCRGESARRVGLHGGIMKAVFNGMP